MIPSAAPAARVSGDRSGAWRWSAYAWATLVAWGVAYFVWKLPVQVSDCLANLMQVQGQTWFESFTVGMGHGYMRPLLWAQIRVMYELADGTYTPLFRGIHVAQVLACALLFVGALRVRDAAGALAVPFGIAMLFGHHTLYGTMNEAFPINSFMSVVVACLAVLNLSLRQPARWHDAVAVGLFAVMVLTVESGVLVWWCLVAAALTGARGVSRGAVLTATACLAAYVLARFAVLDVGTPGIMERSSGFGLRVLEPGELQARFGSAPWLFYGYNVASQVLTVLLGEPSGGVFVVIRDWQTGAVSPGQVIRVLTYTGASLLIAGFIVARLRRWVRLTFDDADRVVFVFVCVLVGNAVISFPYTKDVIVSPAGALHALAAAVALTTLLRRAAMLRMPVAAAASLFVALITFGATVRVAGTCYILREASFVQRNDWTAIEAWAARNQLDVTEPRRAALVRRLRQEAFQRRAPAPAFADPDWDGYRY